MHLQPSPQCKLRLLSRMFKSSPGAWRPSIDSSQDENFAWTEKANQALQQLKDFLSKPPILTAPQDKEELLLYIATTTNVVSTAITIERQEPGHAYKVQRPVYFVSEVLSKSKTRYLPVQKLLYAILLTS